MIRTRCCSLIVLLGLLCPHFARCSSDFDQVELGVLTVYPIDDLTDANAENTKQIDSLIRDTIGVGQWTTTGGTGAALRTTPTHATVKASADVQKQVATLLNALRAARRYYIRTTFRIIDADLTMSAATAEFIETQPRPLPATPVSDRIMGVHRDPPATRPASPQSVFNPVVPADATTILATSERTVMNGEDATWVDGTGLEVPTIKASATISADRKYTTLSIKADDPAYPPAVQIVVSIPAGGTLAIRLNGHGSRWLLFSPTILERILKPL